MGDGEIQNLGRRSSLPKTLPYRMPKTIAEPPQHISSVPTSFRIREAPFLKNARRPARKRTPPCPRSPNIYPNMTMKVSPTKKEGSSSW